MFQDCRWSAASIPAPPPSSLVWPTATWSRRTLAATLVYTTPSTPTPTSVGPLEPHDHPAALHPRCQPRPCHTLFVTLGRAAPLWLEHLDPTPCDRVAPSLPPPAAPHPPYRHQPCCLPPHPSPSSLIGAFGPHSHLATPHPPSHPSPSLPPVATPSPSPPQPLLSGCLPPRLSYAFLLPVVASSRPHRLSSPSCGCRHLVMPPILLLSPPCGRRSLATPHAVATYPRPPLFLLPVPKASRVS